MTDQASALRDIVRRYMALVAGDGAWIKDVQKAATDCERELLSVLFPEAPGAVLAIVPPSPSAPQPNGYTESVFDPIDPQPPNPTRGISSEMNSTWSGGGVLRSKDKSIAWGLAFQLDDENERLTSELGAMQRRAENAEALAAMHAEKIEQLQSAAALGAEKRYCKKCRGVDLYLRYVFTDPGVDGEHLSVSCRTCQHSWREPCADRIARPPDQAGEPE